MTSAAAVIDAVPDTPAASDAPRLQKVAAPADRPEPATPGSTTLERAQPPHPSTPAKKRKNKRARRRQNPRPADASDDSPHTPSSQPSATAEPPAKSSSATSPGRDTSPMPPPKAAAAKRAAGKIVPLFIASIGNPAPTYAHTLHSAGHTALEAVRDLRQFPPFRKDKLLANGLVSRQAEAGVSANFSWLPVFGEGSRKKENDMGEGEENWTLWQSPSLMNESGRALGKAWGRWKRENKDGELVVLHDELQKPLGKIEVRRGGSARGHNGLKSIATQVTGMPYIRIGIGIGRPESREPDDVARYVLRKMTDKEKTTVEDAADEIIRKLWDVQEGKIR